MLYFVLIIDDVYIVMLLFLRMYLTAKLIPVTVISPVYVELLCKGNTIRVTECLKGF